MDLRLRLLSCSGGLACAVAVGLAAWASHGLGGEAARLIGLAAVFSFGHGLALLVLAPGARRPREAGLWLLALGLLLFAGTLVTTVLFGNPTRLAPLGGWLLMAGWLIIAFDALRR